MRKFWLSLIALTILFAGISFGQGPLTNALNLMVRTDSNGSLYVYGVAAGAQGPLTNFGNIRLRTYNGGDLGVTINGGTITPATITTTGAITAGGQFLAANGTSALPSYAWTAEPELGFLRSAANTVQFGADGVGEVLQFNNSTGIAVASNLSVSFTDNVYVNLGTVDTTITRASSGTLGFQAISLTGKATKYNNITSAGWGLPAIQAEGNAVAVANSGTASIATYTVGAADGTFEVGCNILITVSTNHTFSCDTTYTDEGSTARTMVMPVEQLAGTFATSGLMTNITGAGPYESPVMTIRAKAGTAITVRTSAGGTFTTVTYNARGIIKQVG